ncbi:MAG: ABC transporter ATP-binding protein, partial [Mangrovibacterium sp.]
MKIRMKGKDFALIRRFARYLNPHKKWLYISLSSIPVTTGAGIAFLWLVEHLIDKQITSGNVDGLKTDALLLVLVLAVNLLFDGLYSYAFARAGGRAIVDMRKELFGRTIRFPLSYFDKHPIGVTLSRLTSDMESVSESFGAGILGLLSDSIRTLALLGYLFFLNWRLSLVLMLVVPLIVLVIRFLRLKIRQAYNDSRSSLARSAAYLQEALSGMKTIQLYAAEEEAFRKYDGLNRQYCNAQNHSNVYDSALFSIVEGVTSVATALVLWYGAVQVWDYGFTIGVLIVFVTTLGQLFVPVRHFAQQISTIQRALSALEHISALAEQETEEELQADCLAAVAEVPQGASPDSSRLQEIEFRNVSFRYSDDAPDVLKDVSFRLRRGDRLALVGATGSGKSTIIRLLTGMYTGYRGSITLNGRELRKVPLETVRKTMSVMQQDIFMFNDTVGFNIGLGRDGVGFEEVREAASFVFAGHFISRLPGGYDYEIQGNGDNLSKGQTQLISFARAICSRRELIILDEATSAVDSLTEQYIQLAIENIFASRT